MRITVKDQKTALPSTDLLAVLVIQGGRIDLPKGVALPAGAKGFRAEARRTRLCDAQGPAARVLLVGLGKSGTVDREGLRRAAALAVKAGEREEAARVTLWCPAKVAVATGDAEAGEALAEGVAMGSYRYVQHKSDAKAQKVTAVAIVGPGARFRAGAVRGQVLGAANTYARDLQNGPGNAMRPRDLATRARALAKDNPRISCRVLDEPAMKQLGMGALLGVSAGSKEPARLIHLTYRPKRKAARKVALVGKGLTFDAGGISIKPSAKMWDMKYDMSGGAAVLGVFRGLRDMDVPVEVHGIVPASENLPDAAAQKPGDVVTAMNGTTIEVLNTDAEGRLILADALCYTVKKVKPDTIVDLATLTGAVVVALGHELSGMFASTTELRDALTAAGQDTGELVWPLPLLDCHKEQMKGEVADLRNINMPNHGNGSTSGAAFLSRFVGDTEWCHLDIAGSAWGAQPRDYVGGAQGTGVGSRLLLRWLEGLG